MAGGCTNIYTSRRTMHEKCLWWRRNNDDRDLSVLAEETVPAGSFTAKSESASNYRKQELGSMFLFDENTTTISTNDDVDILTGDFVKYQGTYWRVLNVQQVPQRRETEFSARVDMRTYIQMKR